MKTHRRPCPFCEATCGVVIEESKGEIHSIRGDPDDQFSQGYICPKAMALRDLHQDPDRLQRPMMRRGHRWEEIDWDAAFDLAARNINTLRAR